MSTNQISELPKVKLQMMKFPRLKLTISEPLKIETLNPCVVKVQVGPQYFTTFNFNKSERTEGQNTNNNDDEPAIPSSKDS